MCQALFRCPAVLIALLAVNLYFQSGKVPFLDGFQGISGFFGVPYDVELR